MNTITVNLEKINTILMPNLQEKGFRTFILNNEKEVKDFVNQTIPDEKKVGLGDSITTCKLNIRHILATKGSTIFYGWNGSDQYNRSLDTFENSPRPDYYISRINAINLKGELLIKDFSKEAAVKDNFPAHFLAFAGLNRIVEAFDDCESLNKYSVIGNFPAGINFQVILLPFLNY